MIEPRNYFGMLLLALAAATAPVAAVAADAAPRVIRAAASASVKRAPDRARVAVSVTTRAATAREASEANARTSKAVLEKLRSLVSAPGEVSTAGYELGAEYDYNDPAAAARGPRLVGYAATNRLAVVSADLAAVGSLLDAAVAAGATQIDSIAFFLDDATAARREALLRAGAKARAEAATVAESLGVTLGDLVEASSGGGAGPQPMDMREKTMMAAPAATELVPGSLDIEASVAVAYSIP